MACSLVGFSRSALCRPTVDSAAKDASVIAVMNEIVAKPSRCGFWKCFHRLHAYGQTVAQHEDNFYGLFLQMQGLQRSL